MSFITIQVPQIASSIPASTPKEKMAEVKAHLIQQARKATSEKANRLSSILNARFTEKDKSGAINQLASAKVQVLNQIDEATGNVVDMEVIVVKTTSDHTSKNVKLFAEGFLSA